MAQCTLSLVDVRLVVAYNKNPDTDTTRRVRTHLHKPFSQRQDALDQRCAREPRLLPRWTHRALLVPVNDTDTGCHTQSQPR